MRPNELSSIPWQLSVAEVEGMRMPQTTGMPQRTKPFEEYSKLPTSWQFSSEMMFQWISLQTSSQADE